MSLVTLFSNEHGFLATDQLVYSAQELSQLQAAGDLASQLYTSIAAQNKRTEQARKEGYQAGFELGQRQAQVEAKQQLQQTILQLNADYQRDCADQQKACVSLAVDIVRKIAGNVADADWLYAEASTAAAELVDQTGLTLRVHSSRYADVRNKLSENDSFERVVADENLQPDACCIDTRYGTVDVDLETQLEQVKRLLLSERTGDV